MINLALWHNMAQTFQHGQAADAGGMRTAAAPSTTLPPNEPPGPGPEN